MRGVGNLGRPDNPEEGEDHRPSLLCHRVSENLSEGESKVRGGAPTHSSGKHTLNRMDGEMINVEGFLCSVGVIEDSGVASVLRGLGLVAFVVQWVDEGAMTYGVLSA